MKDWYSYEAIKFTRSQILWVLENIGSFEEGKWPFKHGNTAGGSRQFRNEAPFVNPAIIKAEIEIRLKRCGIDGLMVQEMYSYGKDYDYLAYKFKMSFEEAEFRTQRALRYITGDERPRESYLYFCLMK